MSQAKCSYKMILSRSKGMTIVLGSQSLTLWQDLWMSWSQSLGSKKGCLLLCLLQGSSMLLQSEDIVSTHTPHLFFAANIMLVVLSLAANNTDD